mgnify:CR=1 FL=1
MIIILKDHAQKNKVASLIHHLEGQGLSINYSEGQHSTIIGLIGDTSVVDMDSLKANDIVYDVRRVSEPFKAANRKFHTDDTVISVGSETSLDGLRYVSIGDGSVYLVDSGIYSSFSYGLYDLVAKEAIPDMSDLVSFTAERASGTLAIDYLEDSGLAYSDRYTYFADDGGEYTALDSTLAGDFVSQITGLTWGECVDYKAGLKDLADYGLDAPAVTVTVNYIETTEVETNETDEDGNPVYETREEEKSFTLELGDYAGEGVYARIAGSEMVYLIDSAICDSLLYTEVSELLPDDVILLDWDRTEGFDITLDGETYAVTMALEESTDDEGSTSYDYVYTLNGEDVDFTDVLNSLEALESEGSAEGVSTELGEAISFVFHRSTGPSPRSR